MSAIDLAVGRLVTEEGFRPTAYKDTEGKLTIGYGFNVDAGITKLAAQALLQAQATEVWQNLSSYWWWHSLDDVRASVLVDMAFNMGTAGLLHFPKMLAAIDAKDWETAKAELLDSDAARELPARYKVLGDILASGVQ